MRKIKFAVLIGVFSLGLLAFNSTDQGKDWEIPAKYQKMKNPTDAKNAEGLAIGKELYAKHCKRTNDRHSSNCPGRLSEEELII